MHKFFNKYSDQFNGYLFVLPAFLIIGLFGIFPVFFWNVYEFTQMEGFQRKISWF